MVGQVVQIYCPGGISVDVGCSETLAFLEVEEIRIGRCPFFLFRSFEKVGGSLTDHPGVQGWIS